MKKLITEMKRRIMDSKTKFLLDAFKVGVVIQCLTSSIKSYAISNTTLVTGTVKLINDGTTVLLLIEAALVIGLEIWTGIKYQQAMPEEKGKHIKEAKGIMIVGIIIVSASAVIKAIFSYYTA